MQVDLCKVTLQASGVEITPDIENQIVSYCRRRQEKYDRLVASEGIPPKVRVLLEFTKKSKAVAYCKRTRISEHELFLLMHNCSQIGFAHRSKFKEFVPEHLKVLDSDISDMKRGKHGQFLTKIDRIIEERKRNHVHLLERGREWHCFHFGYGDMDSGGKAHWISGAHLHYVSHLWPNLRKRQVWEAFDQRKVNIQGVHIRCDYTIVEPARELDS